MDLQPDNFHLISFDSASIEFVDEININARTYKIEFLAKIPIEIGLINFGTRYVFAETRKSSSKKQQKGTILKQLIKIVWILCSLYCQKNLKSFEMNHKSSLGVGFSTMIES